MGTKKLLKYKQQYLMITPTVILTVLFGVYPILHVLIYSFTNYGGFGSQAKFIGLANYIRVLGDKSWWNSVYNTLILGFGIPLIQIPISLLLAVLLNRKFRGQGLARAIIFIPNITSTAIMGIVFYFMFSSYNGIINTILLNLNLVAEPMEWLGNGFLAKVVVIIFCTWSGVGFYMVLFLSALQRISPDVYESASIDGANGFQTFFKITLPMLGKMFQLITTMSILNALRLFDSVKALTNGGPGNKTEVITMYIYRYFFEGMGNAQQGYASAVSIVATVIIGIVAFFYMRLTNRFED